MVEAKILGNLFGGTGGNWAGMVYAARGCAPSILTMSGGGGQTAPRCGEGGAG